MLSKKLLVAILVLIGLVAFASADDGEDTHYEDDSERDIADYNCESTHFELQLEDALCVGTNRRRSEGETETETETEVDCESSIHIGMSVDGSQAKYEIRRELENGEAETDSRLKVSWTGAGVYTCDSTTGACTAVSGACTSSITSWAFTCPSTQPTSGTWDVSVSSVPAAITLATSFTTSATTTQLPSEVEILVSGQAADLGCTVGTGQLFCVSFNLDTDCQREEDDSATDAEAVGCGAVNFAWATTDSTGTAITSYTSGNDVLYCVDSNVIVSWDPTLSSLGSSGSILAATLALFALVF
jgi:hypothetical protein